MQKCSEAETINSPHRNYGRNRIFPVVISDLPKVVTSWLLHFFCPPNKTIERVRLPSGSSRFLSVRLHVNIPMQVCHISFPTTCSCGKKFFACRIKLKEGIQFPREPLITTITREPENICKKEMLV